MGGGGSMWNGPCGIDHGRRAGVCVLLSAYALLALQIACGGVYVVGGIAVLEGSQISSCTATTSIYVRRCVTGGVWKGLQMVGRGRAAHSSNMGSARSGRALLSAYAFRVLQGACGGVLVQGGSAMMTNSQISSCTASATEDVRRRA